MGGKTQGKDGYPYGYTRGQIAEFAGVSENMINQEVRRGNLDFNDPLQVLVWLAGNARPVIRAKIARQVLPVVFGVPPRKGKRAAEVADMIANGDDFLAKVFEADREPEAKRRKSIAQSKRKKPAETTNA
jgi:hypothetical protein